MEANQTDEANGDPVHETVLDAFGVRAIVAAESAATLARAEAILPPGWKRCEPGDEDLRFALAPDERGSYDVEMGGVVISSGTDLDVALGVLDTQLRMHVAFNSERLIFVHAGAVSHDGHVIALPGASFCGKTTLVSELVRAGATYYSDEYALLDEDGLVHPYPKPLSIRSGGVDQTDHDVSTFGGSAADEPLPLGLVVIAEYRPGAEWRPRRLSAGEGMLALLANTVPARGRTAQALAALRRAVDGAVVLEGDRGEASLMVDEILSALRR
jgi:hypothetical protein